MGQYADLIMDDSGSFALVHPLTPTGREWLIEHCPAGKDHQYWGRALVVEHRYLPDLTALAEDDGLKIRTP
jgi:hypothetical protein